MNPPVLIVGAGPVGLTMAAELARYGIPVRIVEKAARRTDKSKALVIWSRTLELFDRSGLSAAFIAAGHKVTGANITTAAKVIGHIDFGTVQSPYPYALMLPQSETERILEEHLAAIGIPVERQVELLKFTKGDASVECVLKHSDGREETVAAEYLLGCDGAHSTVRHGLGFEFQGNTLESNWILADIHLKGYPFPESEIAVYWHEKGVMASFPISPGRFRIIADVEIEKGMKPREPTLAEVQAVVNERGPGGVVASDPIWLAAFRINERKVADYRSSRVFVAGDAAHVHSPAGGQGMNTGMQDAFNLAWKLGLVYKGTCPDNLLDTYSVERGEVGDHVLKAAGRLTALAIMRNHTAQTARNFIGRMLFNLGPVRRKMANQMTEVTIGYEHTPLNGPNSHWISGPGPGERIPPIAGQMAVGSGDTPRFALFADANGEAAAMIAKYPDLLDPLIRPTLHAGAIWLARPDGYVACVTKEGNGKAIEEYLDKWVGKTV